MATQPEQVAPQASAPAVKPVWTLVPWELAIKEQLLPSAACDFLAVVGQALYRADTSEGPRFTFSPEPIDAEILTPYRSPTHATYDFLEACNTLMRRANEALDEATGAGVEEP